MPSKVIQIESLYKDYRLGSLGTISFLSGLRRKRLSKVLQESSDKKKSPFGSRAVFHALENINCSIDEGESIGIIGKNGAGKSTLLKIISRITSPTKGKVMIRGKVSSLLEIGTGFHPDLTGRENIYLNGSILGMKSKEIKSKLDEIIDFSGIEEFVDTPVKRYSSGMYVRLAFSVAAHLDADILLMDEVLAVGDTEFQKKCLGKMDEVSRKGRTVLFVSHNLEAVRTLCPRTIFLENGNMVSFAETHDVIELYMTKQVTNKMSYEFKSKGSEVELCKIEIMDGQGRLGNYFSWDQSPTVKFDLIIQKLNERAVISFGLVNRFGNRIFTNDYKLNELFRDKGSHTLVIKIPPRLFTPGPYLVSFAIHIPNQDFIYLLEEKVHINFFRPDDENFIYRTDNGSIIVPCIWEAS